jgi:putative addiction module component (TIGR02574 family)
MTQEETEIEKAWYDEAERRLAAYKAGKVKTYPADQVINDAISKLG